MADTPEPGPRLQALKPETSRPETPKPEPLKLEAFLPYRLNVVAQAVSQGLARLYSEEFGISIPEWRIVAALGERLGPGEDAREMTARDVGAHGRMGKVMVSRAVQELLRRRLLTRRTNAHDRRETFLKLTARGEAVYRAIVPRARAYQTEIERGISAADAAAFDRVMQHLLDRADAAEHRFADPHTEPEPKPARLRRA